MKNSSFQISILAFMILAACGSEKKSAPEYIRALPLIADEKQSISITQTELVDTSEQGLVDEKTASHFEAYSFTYREREFMVTGYGIAPRVNWFEGVAAYGLTLENKVLLAPQYDKVGSPNILAINCVEVVCGNQSGLYNLATQRLLPPEYDLLLPSLSDYSKTSLIAQKNGLWYRLQVNDFSTTPLPEFSLTHYLKSHDFTIGGSQSYGLTLRELQGRYDGDDYYVVVPNYLVVLKLLPPQLNYSHSIHATSPYVETIASESLGARIVSMLVAIYDESLNTRGMEHEQVDLMVFKDNEEVTRESIDEWTALGTHQAYRYINDSLIEAKMEIARDAYPEHNQDNPYKYYLVARDGKITSPTCNRTFGFTRFVFIDSSYFKGSFIHPMTVTEKGEFAKENFSASKRSSGNWITEHLSIEDLDIMRNEIFATYGYRFKTTQWQEYFSDKSWYQARHDDVNHLLSERDRHNIQVILRAKARLEKNAAVILNKTPQLYLSVP